MAEIEKTRKSSFLRDAGWPFLAGISFAAGAGGMANGYLLLGIGMEALAAFSVFKFVANIAESANAEYARQAEATAQRAAELVRVQLAKHTQHIPNQESPRTTKLYDQRNDDISLDEVERIGIRYFWF